MNESYDGLNLIQLIDRLEPLVVPDAVSYFPVTPGWWVVGAWLLTLSLYVCWRGYLRWRHNAYRRQALRELGEIYSQDKSLRSAEIATLLKRTALAAYPRNQVASLAGHDWAEFLRDTSEQDAEVVAAADNIASAAYRLDVDAAEIVDGARRWIELHRV